MTDGIFVCNVMIVVEMKNRKLFYKINNNFIEWISHKEYFSLNE